MEADPIRRIYDHAEALRTIAATLPEDQCGLALIVSLLGEDLQKVAEEVDNRLAHARRGAGGTDEVSHELGGLPPLPDAQYLPGTPMPDMPPGDAQGAGRQRTCDSIA